MTTHISHCFADGTVTLIGHNKLNWSKYLVQTKDGIYRITTYPNSQLMFVERQIGAFNYRTINKGAYRIRAKLSTLIMYYLEACKHADT